MSLKEVTITGPNNVKAKVTGQEELLTKVNSIDPNAELNVNVHDAAGNDITSTTIGADTGLDVNIIGGTGVARTPGILRPTAAGNVNSVAATFYSVSVANVGAANGSVLGGALNIKPGEVLNFSADAVNNYFTSFAYDAAGTEFIIIYVA